MESSDPAHTPEPGEPTEAATAKYAEQFFGALKRERGVDISCPACGSDTWYRFEDAGLPILEGRDPATGETEGIRGSMHVVAVTCRRCGFVSMFDRFVIGE